MKMSEQIKQTVHIAASDSLSERYELLDQIGEGGMGAVFKARQIATDRLVAIKFLSGQFALDEGRRARFEQEQKSASALYHPNLISIVDFGCDQHKQPYIVMEYVPGRGLDQILSEKKRLEVHEIIEIFTQICKGLSHAHHKGIIHRDMKPSNVMVFTDEAGALQVKVVDFGIAKTERRDGQSLTQTGEVLGSPLYMSPEQATGNPIDQRSDIYSVGCMLFEACTGEPPFVGENAVLTLCMRLTKDPPSFAEVAPYACLPAELESIVRRCLNRELDQRYQTIAAVHADLKDLERTNPPLKATATNLKSLRQQAPVHEAPASHFDWRPAAIVLLMAAAGAGFIAWQSSQHQPPVRSAPPVVASNPAEATSTAPQKTKDAEQTKVKPEPSKPDPQEPKKSPTKDKDAAKATDEAAKKPKIIPLEPEMQEIVDARKQALAAKQNRAGATGDFPPQQGRQSFPPQGPPQGFPPAQGPERFPLQQQTNGFPQPHPDAFPPFGGPPQPHELPEELDHAVANLLERGTIALDTNHRVAGAGCFKAALTLLEKNGAGHTLAAANVHDLLGRLAVSSGAAQQALTSYRSEVNILKGLGPSYAARIMSVETRIEQIKQSIQRVDHRTIQDYANHPPRRRFR